MSAGSTDSSSTWGAEKSNSLTAVALPRHRTMTDVTTILDARPANGIRQLVGGALCRAHARAESHRAQHAPPIGEYPACLELGAGVEDLAGQTRGALQTLDDIALARGVGITGGGHDHTERCARIPCGAHCV